jgi:hypothetical protein
VGGLVAAGLNDCAIARMTGIPRVTVREWRHTRRWERWPYAGYRTPCPRCGAPPHEFYALPEAYVYLLGLYLGDGHLVECPKRVFRLTVAMNAGHPGLIGECSAAIAAVVPGAYPDLQPQTNSRCVRVVKYSRRWPCPFPSAWARQETQTPDRLDVLAAHARQSSPRVLPTRSHSLGRVPVHQPSPTRRQGLPISALQLLKRLGGHSQALLRRL